MKKLLMFLIICICSLSVNAQDWNKYYKGDGKIYLNALYGFYKSTSYSDHDPMIKFAVGIPINNRHYIEVLEFSKAFYTSDLVKDFRIGTNYVYKPNALFFKAGVGLKRYDFKEMTMANGKYLRDKAHALDFKIGLGVDIRATKHLGIIVGTDLTNSVWLESDCPKRGFKNTLVEPYAGFKIIF